MGGMGVSYPVKQVEEPAVRADFRPVGKVLASSIRQPAWMAGSTYWNSCLDGGV